jgi:hypothetical protein
LGKRKARSWGGGIQGRNVLGETDEGGVKGYLIIRIFI